MKPLTSSQKKFLRGQAHGLKPVVTVGQKGITAALLQSADDALLAHELIKIKFVEFKDKAAKAEIVAQIQDRLQCGLAGTIGHVAILYRPNPDPLKNKIRLPS